MKRFFAQAVFLQFQRTLVLFSRFFGYFSGRILGRFFGAAVIALSLTACGSNNSASYADIDQIEAAKTRISLGLTYLQNGNFNQAKANLDKAINFAPDLMDSHFAMAFYYQSVEEVALAEKYYQQALSIDDRNADLLNSYGAFLCLQGHYTSAEQYLMQAINSQQYSHTASSYENLAICSQAQANISEAIGYLKTALSHEPGRLKSAYLLLEMTVSGERWDEAKMALQKYEKVAPVSARSLDFAVQIEQGLGNRENAQGYADMLARLFPRYQSSSVYSDEIKKTIKKNVNPQLEKKRMSDRIHVVQHGENLYRISLKYNVRMQRLIEWNKLKDGSQVSVGKTLIVSDPNAK